MVFSASGSSDRSTLSLLEVTTRVAPPAVLKISIPFVMPFSLVVTRWLRAARQRLWCCAQCTAAHALTQNSKSGASTHVITPQTA